MAEEQMTLGGEAISEALFNWIRKTVPDGGTIFELGSGEGTKALCEHYEVWSVENNPKWLYHAPSRYIFADLIDGWYDPKVIRQYRPEKYDLLLIDGPRSPESAPTRHNMLKHLDLFDLSVPIVVDDVHRTAERELWYALSRETGRPGEVFKERDKAFGVV